MPGGRTLEVSVQSVTGLSAPVAAYCQVQLLDLAMRDLKKEIFKTKTITKSTTGVFPTNSFLLGQTYNLSNPDAMPTLYVTLNYTSNSVTNSKKRIGGLKIPLDSIGQGVTALVSSYMLIVEGSETEEAGEVMISTRFSTALIGEEGTSVDSPAHVVVPSDEPDEGEEGEPNELHVSILGAKDLQVMDSAMFGAGSSDPRVKIEITGGGQGDVKKTTEVMEKSLNPVWNKKFDFDIADPEASIILTVEDSDFGGVKHDFMGKITIPLHSLMDKEAMRVWKRLGNSKSKMDAKRGELEVLLHWRYNKSKKDTVTRKSSDQGGFGAGLANLIGLGESSDEEADDAPEPEANAKTAEELDKEKKEKDEAKEKLKKQLGDIQIKSGDYQIQVHIIEARDLKAEDVTGQSDPVVYIEAFGQKQNTKVMESCLSCVFDERFIMNFRDVDKDQFEDGQIKITVMDADFGGRNDMIGSFVVDASRIYYREGHEFYRQWVGLIDDTEVGDAGVQGYLKMSISIIGPGDKMAQHDEESDKKLEKIEEEKNGINAAVPPCVKRENCYLVTTIHKCEYLPVMDNNTFSKSGIDAFVKVEMGTASKKTKVVTIKGDRGALNPAFDSEIWLPVTVPVMSDTIKMTIWDEDSGPAGNSLVGTVTDKFNLLNEDSNKSTPPHWLNIYGAQVNGYELGSNLKKIGKIGSSERDWKAHYNKFGHEAPHYRGRVLIEQRIVKSAPPKKDGSERDPEPFRRKLKKELKQSQFPPTDTYKIRAMVVSGTEIPKFRKTLSVGKARKMQIKIQCGKNELYSARVENNNGVCEWYEMCESEIFKYPRDLDSCPDIVVSISKGKDTEIVPIAYKRYTFREVVESNFTDDCKWITFAEDKALDLLEDGQFPGSVLLRLGAGKVDIADRTFQDWEKSLDSSRQKTSYQLRMHVYQARSLPAADSNGLMDPFFKLNFNGMHYNSMKAGSMNNGREVRNIKSMLRKKTQDPLWYETFTFDTELPDPQFFPQVNFQLFDWDGMFEAPDYCGCFNATLGNNDVFDADDHNGSKEMVPEPRWIKLMKEQPGDSDGEILVSFQLLRKMRPEMRMPQIPPNGELIKPETVEAFVEIIVIGCRDLQPYKFLNMQFPKLEFSIDSAHGKSVHNTDNSKRPSGQNPNYLERIVLKCEMPTKSIFAPPMTVKLSDSRLAGMYQPVCGTTKIDMMPKLPWCDDTYVPPLKSGAASDVRGKSGAVALGKKQKKFTIGSKESFLEEKGAAAGAAGEAEADDRDSDAGISPVSPLLPADMKSAIEDKMLEEDTGAGVFGALKHVNAPPPREVGGEREVTEAQKTADEAVKKQASKGGVWGRAKAVAGPTDDEMLAELAELEADQDEGKRYMNGREKLVGNLEEKLVSTPFETFTFWRGQKEDRMEVGTLKGMIRVARTEAELDDNSTAPFQLADLLKPQKYTVRLYVLRGLSLAPMDVSLFGGPGKSDPYLKVNIGDDVYDDRKNFIKDQTEVDFYKCIELHTELPGAGLLEIEVKDYDDWTSDDLIGKTVIDLEDRWFDERWKKLGMENRVTDDGKMRWQTKPLETRDLYIPTSYNMQGRIECWVDIMKTEEGDMFPADDVMLPPSQIFECRLVVWRARDMVSMDALEDMNDLYFNAWIEGVDKQSTDIHWRAKNGKGSFNWRMKFDVELGHNTKAMKFPYLHLQAWDKDVLKYSDCIGEGFENLGDDFSRAYKKNQTVEAFAKRDLAKELESARFRQMQSEARKEREETTRQTMANLDDVDVEGLGDIDEEMGVGGDLEASRTSSAGSMGAEGDGVQLVPMGSGNSGGADKKKKGIVASGVSFASAGAGRLSKAVSAKEFKKSQKEAFKEKQRIQKIKKEKEKKADGEEVEKLVGSMKELCGLGEDPPNSRWIKLMRKNADGEEEEVGQVAVSLTIMPKSLAETCPAGFGRNDPNNDPYLPGPTGRLTFTLNPFSMGMQMLGPALCGKVACICCCILAIVVLYFLAPFLNIFITLTK